MLSFLHEPGVLGNLSTRYSQQQIYTYTGSILIALNPFRCVMVICTVIPRRSWAVAVGRVQQL